MTEDKQIVTMSVALPATLKEFVLEQVRYGHYSSASEVVREALREFKKKASVAPGMSG